MYSYDSKDEAEDRVTDGEQLDGNTDKVTVEAPILARIPDLDVPETCEGPVVETARRDGRLLSQRFSLRLLAGCAVVLVLLAVVPYLLSQRGSGTDRYPAPNATEAPPFVATSAQAPNVRPPLAPAMPAALPNVQANVQAAAAPSAPIAPPRLWFSPEVPPEAGLAGAQQAAAPTTTPALQVPQGPAGILARDPGRPVPDAAPVPYPSIYPSTSPDEPPPRYDGPLDTQANRPMSIDPGRQPSVAGHPAPAPPAASSWEYYRNQYPVVPTHP